MTDADRDRWTGYLRDLADRMGLRDWRVHVLEQVTDEEHDAQVFCVRGRKIANLRLSPRFGELAPERQRLTLVHELVHCHFAAMDELVMGRWDGHEYDAYLIPFEYGVDAIAHVLAPHLPLPLWMIESPEREETPMGRQKAKAETTTPKTTAAPKGGKPTGKAPTPKGGKPAKKG